MFTDSIDGYIARRSKSVSRFGAILDPAMDKFFVQPDATPGQVNLNLATLEQLESHPYLSRLQSRAILFYRYQHGPFKSEMDLMRVKLMDSVTIRKIRPYIYVDASVTSAVK